VDGAISLGNACSRCPGVDHVELLFENRWLPVSDGRFEGTFTAEYS